MKAKLRLKLCFMFSLLVVFNAFAQDKYTISGYVEDVNTGEKLIGANVFAPVNGKGVSTNTYGFYSLTLPTADSLKVAISYVGYQTQFFELALIKDVQLNFKLNDAIDIEAIEVKADRVERIEESVQMSTVDVPIKQIQKIPALLGEVDVLKALQLLPGVQSGGEGTSGLYVRGGSPDQNLILLDGVPVYNASHLFGFFSTFNADAISNVKLTKGGFPARYGGRLSSVLEINMKEGDMNDYHAEGTIGIIASKLTVQGPIIKDKAAFIVSARRTYIDLLIKPIVKAQNDGASPKLYFYDLNAKVNYKFNEKDRLYLSAYAGQDKFGFKQIDKEPDYKETIEGGLDWGNITAALRWNHLWNDKLFSNTTLTYSRYKFDIGTSQSEEDLTTGEKETFAAQYFSGIEDWAGKIDFDYIPNPDVHIRFGTNAIHHTFKPGAINFKVEDDFDNIDTTFGTQNTRAVEMAAYVESDIKIGHKFKANIGLHFSGFAVNEAFYPSIQPRVGMRYLLPKNLAIKASFATMRQYLHLLTNEGLGLPTDLWLPSTDRVKPQSSWQVGLGFAKTFKDFEFSIEGYYKKMDNLIAYKEGASFLGFTDWQDKVEQGQGDSYGAEFFVQKKKGKTTGWVGYTLSWSNRQFDNINFGEQYSYKYDRRHDISIVVAHDFTDRIGIAGTWVYGTGNAVTLPNANYNAGIQDEENVGGFGLFNAESYGAKNDFRMRSYHRFDIGLEFKKKKKHWERKWTIGAYNLYSRKNPFFVYINNDYNQLTGQSEKKLKQVSLFPIVPSFSYSFKF